MQENKVELKLVSKLENLAVIGEFIEGTMLKFGLDAKKVFSAQLAIDEACSNIINYGYRDKSGQIEIVCQKEGKKISIILKDEGTPFDPNTVKMPDVKASAEDRDIGGLGVFFIKKFMDEFHYEYKDNKNILTMVMKI
jgi:anti-sigma regulatory factor (Ser/Thr protein kinase)